MGRGKFSEVIEAFSRDDMTGRRLLYKNKNFLAFSQGRCYSTSWMVFLREIIPLIRTSPDESR